MRKFLAAFAAVTLSVVLAIALHGPAGAATSIDCTKTSTGNIAITDLGTRKYKGEQGGLYPGGSNVAPAAYQTAGIQAASSIAPRDKSGAASASGKIVFISIGMSNTSMEFGYFAGAEMRSDSKRNPAIKFVDGAQGSKTAVFWANSSDVTWTNLESRLASAGVTDKQVQVVWLKEADFAKPPSPPTFATYAQTLSQELSQITSIAAKHFPNLRQVFVSPRTYSGYAILGYSPNPEPWAYETGFADKWFVAKSVANPTQRPWVGWGPYLWTDGTKGRADGLKWLCSDTIDGTHPSSTGLIKINSLMHSLFVSSAVTPWFTGASVIRTQSPSPTPPRTSPGTGGVGSTPSPHSPTTAPGTTPQPKPPTSGAPIPKGEGGIPGMISGNLASLSSLPPAGRWSLLAVAVVLIGVSIAAFSMLVLGRRWRLPIRIRKAQAPTGNQGPDDRGQPPDT